MTLSYPYKDLCYEDISDIAHIGIILGRFPGRYTRPKTGIFSRSQYELSSLQNFVLRHIGRIAPRLSRDCPISREPAHVHARRNFPKIFRKISAEFAPSRRNPQNSAKRLKLRKTPFMLHPAEIFPKIFSKIFSQNFETSGACVENAL